ncbi:hypothetical protein EWM64_g8966 [Hericium alpestre]|uniref:Uncharacterized protein n=1 Tax=Hericium alpestre TaxID=135208 RepID=A0A4Y9ZKU1_9AGAM|nr:hypothetical protein EWM64_g8966 [Hericium alpestre]
MPLPNGDANGVAFIMPNGSSASLLSSGSATPNPAPPLPEKRGFKEIQMVDDAVEVPPPPTPEKQLVVKVITKEPTPEPVPEHADELAKEPEASPEPEPEPEASSEPGLAPEVLTEPEPAPELSRADSGESKKSSDVQDGATQDSLSPEPEALSANSIHEVLPVVDADARS